MIAACVDLAVAVHDAVNDELSFAGVISIYKGSTY